MGSIGTGILERDKHKDDSALREYRFVLRKLIGLVFVQILARHVILWHLVGVDFLLVGVVGSLHTANHVGLERVPFLEQFVDALRIRGFEVGQSLQISSLFA
jgi:hypothetical protein